MAAAGDIYPITLLVEEMKSEDTEARINAMRKLRVIAAALGPERTRRELIPFLNEQVEDDDEVLLVMAEELGGFVDLVGGKDKAVCLLGPLGSLAMTEETVVRDKAVESACTVIKGLDSATVIEHALPLVQRLTQGDWFTARVSACGLFAATYAQAADASARATLRTLFHSLCHDDTPMVRRAASKAIGPFACVVEKEWVVAELLELFNALAADDQDSVRLLAIENCTAFARVLSQPENNAYILPLVKACAGDKSWRVRNNVAREFYPLSESVGVDTTVAELLPLYVKLLQDPEQEVRASAAKNISGYVSLVGPDRFLADILPAIRDIAGDPAQNVRTALAESVMDAASKLGHDAAIAHLLPIIMACLRDEVPEVRLKILDALGKVVGTLGPACMEGSLLPVLLELGGNRLWRVREKVINQLPLLAEALGAAVWEDKLLPLYLASYEDQVNAVRMAATSRMHDIAKCLGGPWVREKLLPRLSALYTTDGASYLQRITVLYGIRDVSTNPRFTDVAGDCLPLVVSALRDEVPNVRFVAAQIIGEAVAAGMFDRARIVGQIRPALEPLAADSDADVKYFGAQALEKCGTA